MANKRIKDLTTTATEADLVSGNYLPIDGSAGTKKLNSTTLLTKTAQNALDSIHSLSVTANDFASDDYIAINGTTNGSRKMGKDSLLQIMADVSQNVSNKNLYLLKELAYDIGEWASYNTTIDSAILTQTTTKTTVFFENDVGKKKPDVVSIVKVRSVSNSAFSLWKVSVDEDEGEATKTKIGDYYGNNDVVEIPVFVELGENDYIGISGTFAYKQGYGTSSYRAVNADGTLTASSVGVVGFVYEGLLDGVITSKFNSVNSYIETLSKVNGLITNSGGNISLCSNSRSQSLVFWPSRSDVPKVKYVTGVHVYNTSDECSLYKVVVSGTTATSTKIMDFTNESFIPLFIELNDNEFIGISGYFRYNSNTGESKYKYQYADNLGNVTTTNKGTIALEIEGFADPKVNTDPYNVVVAADGSGDYTTIRAAMEGTYGIDDATHPVTIHVKPGVYNEPSMNGSWGSYPVARYLSIIGEDKVNTIVQNTNGYYYPGVQDNSCIKVSGNVYIANLTLVSLTTDYDDPSGTEYTDKKRAYCVHVDSNTDGSENVVEINNCRMVNDHSCCVGIGTRDNLHVKIVDCEMKSTFYEPTFTTGGAVVYAHDGNDGEEGSSNQFLTIKDSTMVSTNSDYAVKLYNAHNRNIVCTFVGNACEYNNAGSGADLSTIGEKTKLCSGNNVPILNYT